MDIHFLEGGIAQLKDKDIAKMLGIPESNDELTEDIADMAAEAAGVAVPKAIYMRADIEEIGDGYIVAGGARFDSHLVSKNTEHSRFILPYTATCGRELYEWSKKYTDDPLLQYAAEAIQELYLRRICAVMAKEAKKQYFPDKDISSMAPGSLDAEWPITQQKALFGLLGENAARVGVELTESCLMIPAKSVSGFYFSADEHFENCMLCSRAGCPNRRAKYRGGM